MTIPWVLCNITPSTLTEHRGVATQHPRVLHKMTQRSRYRQRTGPGCLCRHTIGSVLVVMRWPGRWLMQLPRLPSNASVSGACNASVTRNASEPMIKKSWPNEITYLPKKCTLCPLFYSLPRPTHSLHRPSHSFPSLLRSQGLRELHGSWAVKTHWFRWKEIDVLFTIAVTLLPRRRQSMADNYRDRESRTAGGPIYFTLPFQVPDMLTARWQHGPVAR